MNIPVCGTKTNNIIPQTGVLMRVRQIIDAKDLVFSKKILYIPK